MKKYVVYMECDYTKFQNRNYLQETYGIDNPSAWAYYECDVDGFSFEEANKLAEEVKAVFPDAYVSVDEKESFDVVFQNEEHSDAKGFNTYDSNYCREYIEKYNGTDESYFADYKGGVVCIVNSKGDILHEEIE